MTHPNPHDAQVIDQFTQQAPGYTQLVSRPDTGKSRLEPLLELLDLSAEDEVLDVACGPGTLALNLAPLARWVTGIDLTPAMLEQARNTQQQRALINLDWQLANACALPFADHRFSRVVCRSAFHHLQEPRRVFGEMTRVCRSGGRIAVIDVMPGPNLVAAYDEIEKKRDPSHVHAHTEAELRSLGDGLPVSAPTLRVNMTPYLQLDAVLATSFPRECTRADICAVYEAAARSPAKALGVDVTFIEGKLCIAYPMATVVWHKHGA